jgi:hypothetical protein
MRQFAYAFLQIKVLRPLTRRTVRDLDPQALAYALLRYGSNEFLCSASTHRRKQPPTQFMTSARVPPSIVTNTTPTPVTSGRVIRPILKKHRATQRQPRSGVFNAGWRMEPFSSLPTGQLVNHEGLESFLGSKVGSGLWGSLKRCMKTMAIEQYFQRDAKWSGLRRCRLPGGRATPPPAAARCWRTGRSRPLPGEHGAKPDQLRIGLISRTDLS